MRRSITKRSVPVVGVHIDGAREATLTLHLDTATVSVRGKRRRRVHALPLHYVAQMIYDRVAKLDAERIRRER